MGRISLISAAVALCLSSLAFYKVSKMDAQIRALGSDLNSQMNSNGSELRGDSAPKGQMSNSEPVVRVDTPAEPFSAKSETSTPETGTRNWQGAQRGSEEVVNIGEEIDVDSGNIDVSSTGVVDLGAIAEPEI